MRETIVELNNVTKKFGDFTAVKNISLQIKEGEFFSLLGPSGCGKTTLLRMIAGFESPTIGEVLLNGESVGHLPPFKRNVNTVFQSYALFPHMSVMKNVTFGLEMARLPKKEVERRAADALDMVQMGAFHDRKPKQLSGGQRQRVALARALVNRPELLLLDEPLGALDLKLRKEMQIELKQIQIETGITFIYVTHDQEEALTMSDRIGVMNVGEITQVGSPKAIYEHPKSRFVAGFIGETNLFEGTIVEIDLDNGVTAVDVDGAILKGINDHEGLQRKKSATLSIRPEKIRLYPPGDVPERLLESAAYGMVNGHIEKKLYIGTDMRYVVALDNESERGERFSVRAQNNGIDAFGEDDPSFDVGDPVHAYWLTKHAQILIN